MLAKLRGMLAVQLGAIWGKIKVMASFSAGLAGCGACRGHPLQAAASAWWCHRQGQV